MFQLLDDVDFIYEAIENNGGQIDLWTIQKPKFRTNTLNKVRAIIEIEKNDGYSKLNKINFYIYRDEKITNKTIDKFNRDMYCCFTEEEAIQMYNDFVYEQIIEHKREIEKLNIYKDKLENSFIGTDIVMETLVRN